MRMKAAAMTSRIGVLKGLGISIGLERMISAV